MPAPHNFVLHGSVNPIFQMDGKKPPFSDSPGWAVDLKSCAKRLVICPGKLNPPWHLTIQCRFYPFHLPENERNITDSQFCRRRRCGRPQISHIVRNGGIRLMPYCWNHRNTAVKNCLGHPLLIKCPQIFNRAAAPSCNNYIHLRLFQRMYTFYNTFHRRVSLDNRRVQNNLHIRISSCGNIYDIPYRRPCWRRHHAESSYKPWNGPFILGCKHSQLWKLLL